MLKTLINPFTPKSDQYQISPAASPEILHHIVWRTWLFIAISELTNNYTTNSQYITHTFLFWRVGRTYFLNLGVKGLMGRYEMLPPLAHTAHQTIELFQPVNSTIADELDFRRVKSIRLDWCQTIERKVVSFHLQSVNIVICTVGRAVYPSSSKFWWLNPEHSNTDIITFPRLCLIYHFFLDD